MQLNTNTLVSHLRRCGDKVLRRELAGEMLTPLISSRAKTRLMPQCDPVRGGILRERVSQTVCRIPFPPVVYIPLISKRSLSLLLLSNLVCADIGVGCTAWVGASVGMRMSECLINQTNR